MNPFVFHGHVGNRENNNSCRCLSRNETRILSVTLICSSETLIELWTKSLENLWEFEEGLLFFFLNRGNTESQGRGNYYINVVDFYVH